MASIDPTELPSVTRQNFFSASISVTPDVDFTVTDVTCVPQNGDSSGITIITTTSSVSISGKNLSASFLDQASFVEKGSSDKLETPTNVTGPIWGPNSLVPPNKELYSFKQDSSSNRIKSYVITVTEQDISNTEVTSTFVISQTILNDWSSGTIALKEYYGT